MKPEASDVRKICEARADSTLKLEMRQQLVQTSRRMCYGIEIVAMTEKDRVKKSDECRSRTALRKSAFV
ncbi:hypothetical protein A2T82_00735 [Burkholderia cenocepacia]|nr:hypothetical protein A2T82_00735 [Burkholderia cenocepacia]